ncbi:MAG: N4-gp56 family major capsid protein [Chloroflexia bacterium]|nr:N4-gp56 family major capsid protein [Chloroflexia bacterium]
MAQTNYSNLYGSGVSQRTAAWAAAEALAHAEPIAVLSKFAQVKPLPKNTAEGVTFRRPIPFDPATTPLAEGVTPTTQALQYEKVSATLAQYGAATEITDVVADLVEDPVLKDAMMLSGEQAQETLEMILYGEMKAGTNVFYANDDSRVEVDSAISLTKQRAVVRALKAARAKKVTQMVGASVKVSTEPIDAAFIAFCHTDCESDIRDMTGFVPVEKYGQMKALPYEIGKVEDVRYICSPLLVPWADAGGTASTNGVISTGGTAADVYPVIYIAKDSYATVPLKGHNAIKPMVLNPGTPSKSDPLGQLGYVSWKSYFTAKILNESWIARLEVAVTDNEAA